MEENLAKEDLHNYSIGETTHVPRAVLNISGHIYETKIETLERFPNTLLGNREKRRRFYNSESNNYFFDRSRVFFDAILFFYQSGILACPKFVPYELFLEECRYFELPEEVIQETKLKSFKCLDEHEGCADDLENHCHTTSRTLKSKIWDILQNPKSSPTASYFSSMSMFAVVLSVASSSLQSIPSLDKKAGNSEAPLLNNPWTSLELLLNTFFLAEFVLSSVSAPNRKKFFNRAMTWIDVFAVVPYFVLLALANEKLEYFQSLRILRLFRVARIFRFSKHSKRLALVGKILLSCSGDMKVLMLCVLLVVTLAGSFMYYLEQMDERNTPDITSTPVGMYWAVQTLVTVGYGDLVPHTYPGKLFAGVFMMFGSATIVIPLLSIIAKFQAEWDVDHHWINKCD